MDNFKFSYVSAEQLERVVNRVRQERQDKEDEVKWGNLLLRLQTPRSNLAAQPEWRPHQEISLASRSSSSDDDLEQQQSLPNSSDSESESESTSSTSSSSSSDNSPDEDYRPKVPTRETSRPKSNKTFVKEKPKFDHHQTILVIRKCLAALKGVLSMLLERIGSQKNVRLEDLGSPRAEDRRKVRLAEFNARVRRNYVYILKTEVDRLNSHIQKQGENIAKNTVKQSALRMLSRALNVSYQALQAFRNQTILRRDFLSTLALLESILDLLSQLEEALVVLKVEDPEFILIREKLSSSLGMAYAEAENERMQEERMLRPVRKNPKPAPKKGAKKKTDLTKKPKVAPKRLQPFLYKQDVGTSTPEFVPLPQLVSQVKSMERKPVNIKFTMMKHDGVEGVCVTETETAQVGDEKKEVETQTAGQTEPLDETKNCRIEQMIAQVLNQEFARDDDYLADIIEQVICQEFL